MSIRFTERQDELLSRMAEQSDIPKQELIRIAVDDLLDRLERGEKVVIKKVLELTNAPSAPVQKRRSRSVETEVETSPVYPAKAPRQKKNAN